MKWTLRVFENHKQNKRKKKPHDFPEAPLFWKLMKIGMDSAKDICENVPFFQVSGSTPASPTPLYLEYLKTINKKKKHVIFLWISSDFYGGFMFLKVVFIFAN